MKLHAACPRCGKLNHYDFDTAYIERNVVYRDLVECNADGCDEAFISEAKFVVEGQVLEVAPKGELRQNTNFRKWKDVEELIKKLRKELTGVVERR